MITPQLVKELREKTGAGMADCKKALDETQGNMEAAIEYFRKKGAATIAKRSDKSANEGLVVAVTSDDMKKSAIVEVNCETDFVARNEEFVTYVNAVANSVLSTGSTGDDIWNVDLGGKTLGNLRDEILAKFSERIELRRAEYLTSAGTIVAYNHAGNKLGVLLETNAATFNDVMRDVAMQVAAMNPIAVNRDGVDASAIEKEIAIYREQAINEGKKPEIAERIATGRLDKFYSENCLLEQSFVKDGNKTVGEVVKGIAEDATVLSFKRFFLGEQI